MALGWDAGRRGFSRYVHRAKSEAPELRSSLPPDFDFLGLFRSSQTPEELGVRGDDALHLLGARSGRFLLNLQCPLVELLGLLGANEFPVVELRQHEETIGEDLPVEVGVLFSYGQRPNQGFFRFFQAPLLCQSGAEADQGGRQFRMFWAVFFLHDGKSTTVSGRRGIRLSALAVEIAQMFQGPG